MSEEPRGESQRKPINPELPAEVKALLANMEQMADERDLSFTKIAAEISNGGEKMQAVTVRRWRSGDGFPSEPAVRRWAEICSGDVAGTMALFPPAKAAHDQWRQDRRDARRKGAGKPGPDGAGDPQRPVHRRVAFAVAGAVIVVAIVAITVVVAGGRRSTPSADPCSYWWDEAEMAAPAPTAAAGTQLPFMYKVPSGAGSTDVVITTGGSVVQTFRSSASRIDRVGVIIGIDPKRGDVEASHPVRFEILERVEGRRPLLLGRATAAMCVRPSRWSRSSPPDGCSPASSRAPPDSPAVTNLAM